MSQFSKFPHSNIIIGFCFICDKELKTFQSDIKCDTPKRNEQIYQRFQSILSRYLNINLPEASKTLGVINPDLEWDKLECCESCFDIVKKVCEIYEQWKNLQLELNWNLNKLGEIVKKCSSNLIYNQPVMIDFKREFSQSVESMNRNEYPYLILDKVTISHDDEQQLQNQSVSVKLEDDENEESSLSDTHKDMNEMDTMDLPINNHIDINCVTKPELMVKVKPKIRTQAAGTNQKKKKSLAIAENGGKLKKFSCSFCHKRFVVKRDMQRHAMIHTGEKPFQCRICEKRFSRKDVRQTHEMSHNQENSICKYQCRFCSKKFGQNAKRIKHEWTHTGLKPFQCSFCEQRFGAFYSAKRHISLCHKYGEDAKVVKNFNSYKEFE